jgi:hypothetical protein
MNITDDMKAEGERMSRELAARFGIETMPMIEVVTKDANVLAVLIVCYNPTPGVAEPKHGFASMTCTNITKPDVIAAVLNLALQRCSGDSPDFQALLKVATRQ